MILSPFTENRADARPIARRNRLGTDFSDELAFLTSLPEAH